MTPTTVRSRSGAGALIVLTAPLTETIDHAGYFIQMSMASLPVWLEGILNRKYPAWRNLEPAEDGTARYMPAGVRVLEATLLQHYADDDVVACYPDDVDKFIGPATRVVAISTHNPLGVTFAAGVYTSIFGESKQPINAHYATQLFSRVKANPYRADFKVLVGGSGGWQIKQTDSWDDSGRRLHRRRALRVAGHGGAVRACDRRRAAAAALDVQHPLTIATAFSYRSGEPRSASSR